MKLLSIIAGYMVPHPPLIIPAVGRGEEKGIAETVKAYEQVGDEIAALGPETIIITSPHTVMYSDYFHISGGSSAYGSFAQFRAPQTETEVRYDEELTDAICRQASDASFRQARREKSSRSLTMQR
jgi:aromatic ring-opening dioxygenase LigB subunit